MAFLKKKKDPFQEIQNCLQKRDYKGALGWFSALLKKDPKNTQIRLRYADTLVLAGSKNEAIRQYRTVADELAEAGFMIRAIAINKKIVQLDPGQADVHEKLAAMNQERSKSVPLRSSGLPLQMPKAEPVAPEPAPPAGALAIEPDEPGEPGEAEEIGDIGDIEVEVTQDLEEPPEPTLSLEQSMEMEFGESAQAGGEVAQEIEPPVELVESEETTQDVSFQESAEELPDEPSFSEEPLALGAGEQEEEEELIDLQLEEEPAEEEEIGLELDLGEEAEELGEPEEAEEIVLDIEMEPEMAADGAHPLVGLLGDDIDSLIDSIIDDVGSSAAAAAAPAEPPPTHIPLFSELTVQEFIDVALMLVRRTVKPGTVIVRQGEPGDSMFIVSTGEAEASIERNGRPVNVATFRDGDFFGEMAVLSGEPRTATVTAVKSTELLELDREHLTEICSRHPEVEAKIRLAYDARVMKRETGI